MANIPKIQKALYPHIPKIDPGIRIPLNIYKNIPYPLKFLANIHVPLKPLQGLVNASGTRLVVISQASAFYQ